MLVNIVKEKTGCDIEFNKQGDVTSCFVSLPARSRSPIGRGIKFKP